MPACGGRHTFPQVTVSTRRGVRRVTSIPAQSFTIAHAVGHQEGRPANFRPPTSTNQRWAALSQLRGSVALVCWRWALLYTATFTISRCHGIRKKRTSSPGVGSNFPCADVCYHPTPAEHVCEPAPPPRPFNRGCQLVNGLCAGSGLMSGASSLADCSTVRTSVGSSGMISRTDSSYSQTSSPNRRPWSS